MRIIKRILLFVSILLLFGCVSLSSNISKNTIPGENQGIAFMGVKMSGNVYYWGVFINEEHKNIRQVDGRFNFSSKSPVEAILLKSGIYYLSIATYANLNIYLNKPKIKVKVDKNYINYLGTIEFKADQINMDFDVKMDVSGNTYHKAIDNFKQKFPEISRKYKFKYALLK